MHFVLPRYLLEDEVVPTISKLHPSEVHYAKDQAKYIMSVVWFISTLSFFYYDDK